MKSGGKVNPLALGAVDGAGAGWAATFVAFDVAGAAVPSGAATPSGATLAWGGPAVAFATSIVVPGDGLLGPAAVPEGPSVVLPAGMTCFAVCCNCLATS